MKSYIALALLLSGLRIASAAETQAPKPISSSPPARGGASQSEPSTTGRSKTISFDNNTVIEGVGKNPYASANSTQSKDKSKSSLIYRIKGNFNSEVTQTVEDMSGSY